MAYGWLEDQEQQFFYNGIRALEKRWTKFISVSRCLCWKVTKYDVRISYLTVSVYELFERPSYIPVDTVMSSSVGCRAVVERRAPGVEQLATCHLW